MFDGGGGGAGNRDGIAKCDGALWLGRQSLWNPVSQSVDWGPVASASPRNWLEMHVISPMPELLNQKLQVWGPAILLNELSR